MNKKLMSTMTVAGLATLGGITEASADTKYTIEKGDTLSHIALEYATTVRQIASENNIENPDLIFAGNTLWINGVKTQVRPTVEKTPVEMDTTVNAVVEAPKAEEVQAVVEAESAPKAEEVQAVVEAEEAPKTEEVQTVVEAESAPKAEEVETVVEAESAPKTEEVETVVEAESAPKAEEVETVVEAESAPKAVEVQTPAPKPEAPKVVEVQTPAPKPVAPKVIEVQKPTVTPETPKQVENVKPQVNQNLSVYDRFLNAGGSDMLWNVIVMPESGGNPEIVSPSGYRGLGQTKEAWGVGTVEEQTAGMLNYAEQRYGSVAGAVAFRLANGWW